MHIEKVLASFPKTRPPLSEEQKAIYEEEYIANREGADVMSSMAKRLEAWMHRQVNSKLEGSVLLEIGAGTLNFAKYLDATNKTYDVIEPQPFLYNHSNRQDLVRHCFNDIEECEEQYDSIFSIAVLEHITNLPSVMARSGLLLKPRGVFVNAIPCEGGLTWGLAWRCTTSLSYYLRTGLSYKNLMRHEHVNTYNEIVTLYRYLFEKVDISFFPLWGKHLSFYACIRGYEPRLDRCQKYA